MANGNRSVDAVQPRRTLDDGAHRRHRHVERVFNPERKETHWGKRKLKRDQ
jgi:hypothetical protein